LSDHISLCTSTPALHVCRMIFIKNYHKCYNFNQIILIIRLHQQQQGLCPMLKLLCDGQSSYAQHRRRNSTAQLIVPSGRRRRASACLTLKLSSSRFERTSMAVRVGHR
jgi:hypothetical protein